MAVSPSTPDPSSYGSSCRSPSPGWAPSRRTDAARPLPDSRVVLDEPIFATARAARLVLLGWLWVAHPAHGRVQARASCQAEHRPVRARRHAMCSDVLAELTIAQAADVTAEEPAARDRRQSTRPHTANRAPIRLSHPGHQAERITDGQLDHDAARTGVPRRSRARRRSRVGPRCARPTRPAVRVVEPERPASLGRRRPPGSSTSGRMARPATNEEFPVEAWLLSPLRR